MTDDDRLTLGESDLETVWVKSSYKHPTRVVHTDPDCRRLNGGEVVSKDADVLDDDKLVCLICLGEKPVRRGGNRGVWQQLEKMDADDLRADGGEELRYCNYCDHTTAEWINTSDEWGACPTCRGSLYEDKAAYIEEMVAWLPTRCRLEADEVEEFLIDHGNPGKGQALAIVDHERGFDD